MVASVRRYNLSVLVVTEDAAADAHETLVALLKRTFVLLCPGVGTHRIDFEPADNEARHAVQGSLWKSKRPADHRALVKLRRTIARKLIEPAEAPGFVVFHVDGDRPWSRREHSENAAKIDDLVLSVHQLVAATLVKDRREGTVADPMARLLVWMPFYSIEAWLYQSTDEARRLCHVTGCGRHDELLTRWSHDRRALDEVERPKEMLCLKSRYNAALARCFPAEPVRAAGTSYTEAVAVLEHCSDLQAALGSTQVWSARHGAGGGEGE